MTTHDLKVLPEFFGPIEEGSKLFELRRNDRDFEEGDWLKLREWRPADFESATPAGYTGARCLRQIAYVLHGGDTMKLIGSGLGLPDLPLDPDWVILGLAPPITQLQIQLKGKRLFVEGVDPKVAVELSTYLADLAAFVERTKAEVVAAKRRVKS